MMHYYVGELISLIQKKKKIPLLHLVPVLMKDPCLNLVGKVWRGAEVLSGTGTLQVNKSD